MTSKVDFEAMPTGVRVTRLTTIDKNIVIPDNVNGQPVRSIGPRFLSDSRGGSARTLIIPATVTSMDPAALDGTTGIVEIRYEGELEVFEGFKLVCSNDCVVRCPCHGKEFRFEFMANHPMSFPEFDDAVLSLYMRLTPEVALNRLIDPVGLTDVNRDKYRRFISDRIMPRAEQAVSTGDSETLMKLLSTGMISDDDLRRLLDRSLRSGRIPMTSILMSETRRRAEKKRFEPARGPAPRLTGRAPTCI